MTEMHPSFTSETSPTERGELFSLILSLHPRKPGYISPGAGNQVQAAFLDMVRQGDPVLSERLHVPNQRRPYTVGLLQGFKHLTPAQLEEIRTKQQLVPVTPEQTYWLRITMLDAAVFGTFARYLITNARTVTVRLGNVDFSVSHLLSMPENDSLTQAWVAYTSFADLCRMQSAQKLYDFEFVTPTAFSMGQKSWGKLLRIFPEPTAVFDSLARQWNLFAPPSLRMEAHGITSDAFTDWCEEHLIITRYTLATSYLPSSKFGQPGFQGTVTYEVKGPRTTAEAQWISPLARFALFAGIGYKTTMGMGQVRCTNIRGLSPSLPVEKEERT